MIEIRNRKTNRFLYRVHADSLEGVDLRGAELFRADLAGANLSGADLREANLHPRELGWGVLYTERLLALSGSGFFALTSPEAPAETLVQARFRRDGDLFKSHFRLTPLGIGVRAGEEDALARGLFRRWVGGRLISNQRQIRRKGRTRPAL